MVHGHTGHVRFLTSVELSTLATAKLDATQGGRDGTGDGADDKPEKSEKSDKSDKSDKSHGKGSGVTFPDLHRRSSMAAITATMASRMLVISGGDGYEDFRNSAANEGAGRDDSTNHLLLWQV